MPFGTRSTTVAVPRPPEPFEGLVPIAEFGNKTEADVALSALIAEGFAATLRFQPQS